MDSGFLDGLREYSRLCSKSLSDDTELCQQVEHELLGHLEDAFEEERTSVSDEQAMKNAMRRFGNPEELSSQLAESNAGRLSRHARIRRAVRWLALPLLVIGVILCIDIRSIISNVILLRWANPEVFGMSYRDDFMGLGLRTRTLSDGEQLLFDYYLGNLSEDGRIGVLSQLYASNRDDVMICALYAQELSHCGNSVSGQLTDVLATGRGIDPGNSLYDYLECEMLIRESCALPARQSPEEDLIKDPAKLDEAMAIYRRALLKGIVRNYGVELQNRIRGMLKVQDDLLGGLHLIEVASRERTPLRVVSTNIARGVALYCDFLHSEGDNAKAQELLRSWRVFIPQFVEREGACMVDILAGIRQVKTFLMCAKRLDMAYETSVLQAGEDIDREMLDSMRVHSTLSHRSAGGLLSRIVPPYSEGGDNVAEWSTERKLEVAAFDSMAIGLSCLVLLVAIVLFSLHALFLRIGGRHPFLFILPKTAYAALLLKGILLPALIYIVALFFIAGNDAPGFRPIHVAPCVFLCVIWPLGYAAYCRYLMARWIHSIGAGNHNAFQASRSLNMACLLVVLLLPIGGVLRPISSWRQRHYARQETLVIPRDGVETYEKRVIRKWQERFHNLCGSEYNSLYNK